MVEFISTNKRVESSSILLHTDRKLTRLIIDRQCTALFGVRPNTCVFIWLNLGGLVPDGTKPEHLIWGLTFLKLYEVENAFSNRVHANEKHGKSGLR